jgi:hypothetical protein
VGILVDCAFVGTPVAYARKFGKGLVTGHELHTGHEVVPFRRENPQAPTAYQLGKNLDWSDVAQTTNPVAWTPITPCHRAEKKQGVIRANHSTVGQKGPQA